MSETTFGTDGWRGEIARDFTFERLARVTAAIVRHLQDENLSQRGLVVGYDRRFQSRAFAEEVATTATAHGLDVWLAQDYVPSPAVSWAVREKNAGAGIIITASHNPPQYNGLKLKEHFGGSARPATTEKIERFLQSGAAPRRGAQPGSIHWIDMRHSYLEQLGRFIDKAPLEGAARAIGLDVMHGATGDLLVSLLSERGFRVTLLHGDENPGFGGICPNPIAAHLQDLAALIAAGDVSLGLAVDGDGDRLAAFDEEGEFLGPQELFPLLLRHLLVRRKERGQVIKSASTTQMIDRICATYDLPLTEVAVGFKHACQAILDDQVLIAGEESGAPGIPRHLPDRDGQMAALLLLEALGCEKLPLSVLRRNLQQQFGPLYYRQRNLELPGTSVHALRHHLECLAPSRIGNLQVKETSRVDGVKWRLEHDAWLLLRLSGTEPLVRLYAEASEAQTAEDLLDCGQYLFDNAARKG